jgi:uncharacterized protein DUF4112
MRDTSHALRFARLLAELLDRRFTIPGTDIRIGLDPLIGLIPGVGDAAANLMGFFIVVVGAQMGLPRIALVRMAVNIALNAVIGSIPVLGDLFSIWFKSNVRNIRLLERHASAERVSTVADWSVVLGLLMAIVLLFLAALAAIVWLATLLWQWAG